MDNLADLIAQKENLEQRIAEIRKKERENAIATVRSNIKDYDLSSEDIFPTNQKPKSTRAASVPKYKDPETGKTWSGQGRTPKWLEGKNKEEFLI